MNRKEDAWSKALLKRNAELSAENEKLTEALSQYDDTSVKELVETLHGLQEEYLTLIAELKDKINSVDKVSAAIGSAESALHSLNNTYEQFMNTVDGNKSGRAQGGK